MKQATNLYKFSYFFVSSSYGYYIMKDTHFLSNWYGGNALSYADNLRGMPYPDRTGYPLVKPYLLICFGYHV